MTRFGGSLCLIAKNSQVVCVRYACSMFTLIYCFNAFYNPNLFLIQPIQLINHSINSFISTLRSIIINLAVLCDGLPTSKQYISNLLFYICLTFFVLFILFFLRSQRHSQSSPIPYSLFAEGGY